MAKEKILIVDDEAAVIAFLKRFLESKGYDVYTAVDGESAIKMVQKYSPDVVLLDIIMPGIGGIEALKEIKKNDPSVTVVMATAVSDEELARRALELGAYDYITKPFNFNYLEDVLMVKLAELL